MRCVKPLAAWMTSSGQIIFNDDRSVAKHPTQIPCGQCIHCKLNRSRDWATRCVHEAQLHEADWNCTVTLTYRDKDYTPTLDHRHFQLFMKRLRKKYGMFDPTLWMHVPRYYMAGEYGSLTQRTHYHACLFGVRFPDMEYYGKSASGDNLYTSQILDNLWQLGECKIGALTFESAAYIARYITEKITGEKAAEHYEAVDGDTGEIIDRTPEYNQMSRRPGIGKAWIEKYHADVYPHDRVVIRGTKYKPPRYYDKHYKELNELAHKEIKEKRKEANKQTKHENTKERLQVQETVTYAKLKLKRKTL